MPEGAESQNSFFIEEPVSAKKGFTNCMRPTPTMAGNLLSSKSRDEQIKHN